MYLYSTCTCACTGTCMYMYMYVDLYIIMHACLCLQYSLWFYDLIFNITSVETITSEFTNSIHIFIIMPYQIQMYMCTANASNIYTCSVVVVWLLFLSPCHSFHVETGPVDPSQCQPPSWHHHSPKCQPLGKWMRPLLVLVHTVDPYFLLIKKWIIPCVMSQILQCMYSF